MQRAQRQSTSVAFSLGLCLLSAATANAQRRGRTVADQVTVTPDVEYGRAGDYALKLDTIEPKQKLQSPRPAIVFIHGGGWRSGDKRAGVGRLSRLVVTGKYVGFSINYRLSGEAIWPAQIHDCKAAIRWVKSNAEKYDVDPQRIAVWGSSAGGHLVSLLGTSGAVAELNGVDGTSEHDSRVACVVDYCGPSDFLLFSSEGPARPAVEGLFGGPVDQNKEAVKLASPITHISKDDPPFLIVHGTNDRLVPIEQAETLHKQLQDSEVESTFVRIEGGGHGIGGAEVEQRVANFLARHLLKENVEVSGDPIVLKAGQK